MIETIIGAMGVGRVIIGLAPFVAAGPSSRLMGYPAAHDNPSSRIMARMFGVRDVGLGVLAFWALRHPELLPFITLFNALTDFGDVFSISIPLVRRQGIDRAAIRSGALGLSAGVSWLIVRAFLS